MTTSCIVLAAGLGTRFGSPKQNYELNGKPLWQTQVEAANPLSDDVIVVGIDIDGGETRQESVYLGLNEASGDRVVILEAARPLVTTEDIQRLLEHPEPSVSYALPVVDTTCSLVHQTYIDRDGLFSLQIPQVFDKKILLSAHRDARECGSIFTDDTSLLKSYAGIFPKLIPGSIRFTKVTYPEDLFWLEIFHEQANSSNHRG